jgi:S-methylmethionine-dependent homocysteine/selenocysteine methylase
MSSDFEQQQKSPATQQAEECSSMKIKPDSELSVLTTHSSTSVEKPLSIDINAAESVEGPSSNEKLNITPNASSLHSNQSTTHESQTSRNSDSVCGCCGLETAQIRFIFKYKN